MKEIEIKILNISPKKIIDKLHALGAKKLGRVLVIEKMFDFKNTPLSRRHHSLRLRKVGTCVELAYKTKASEKNEFKVLDEIQTEVQNYDAMEKIISRVGLKCIKHREKYRTSFRLGQTAFEIDEYPGIPPYLEIEGSPEHIKRYVALLGFTMHDTSSLSSTKVLKKYGVPHDFLTFKGRHAHKPRS